MEGSCGWVIEWREKEDVVVHVLYEDKTGKSILIIIFGEAKRYALCGSSD